MISILDMYEEVILCYKILKYGNDSALTLQIHYRGLDQNEIQPLQLSFKPNLVTQQLLTDTHYCSNVSL